MVATVNYKILYSCAEEITKSISTEAASTSLIIPFIQAFRLTLEKHDDSDRGIRTMKADILASLNRRYENIETNTTLTVATFLDPHFKDKFFSKSDPKTKTIEALNSKLSEMNRDEDGAAIVLSPNDQDKVKAYYETTSMKSLKSQVHVY